MRASRLRHDTVILCASPTGNYPERLLQRIKFRDLLLTRHVIRGFEGPGFLTIAALHQANYATIANYLERELRYMDAGERGSKAP
jgi:hypothetical protein